MNGSQLTRWLVGFDGKPTVPARAVIAVLVAAAFLGGFVARASTHEDGAAPVTAAAIASDAAATNAAQQAPVQLRATAALPPLRGKQRRARPEPAAPPPALEAQLAEQPPPAPTPAATPSPTAVPAPPPPPPPPPAARPAPPPPPPPAPTFDLSG